MRILLVEDDEGIREVFKLVFETESPIETHDETIVVDTAGSGRQAEERLTHAVPDIILLDLTLPDEHGFETFHRIRRMSQCANVPIIALTAHNQQELREEATKLGFTGFVTKPFDFQKTLFPLLLQHSPKNRAKKNLPAA